MLLDNAILAHHVWKTHLKTVIANKGQIDAAVVSRDDCCEIGKWLHAEGRVAFGTTPQFTSLLEKHKVFHTEAGKVAAIVNSGRYDEAARMVESGTPFASASLAVGMAVKALQSISV